MKRYFLIGGLLVIVAITATYVFLQNQNGEEPSVFSSQKGGTDSTQSVNPYSIEALRKRKMDAGVLKLEEKVAENSQFTSYLASYMSDQLKILALVNIPTTQRPKRGFPVLIVNHGYINPEVYSTTDSYRRTADYYASQGFLVIKPDYRANGLSQGEKGLMVNRLNYAVDILWLLASLKSFPDADPKNIFMWGHSMGGEVTLRVLETTNQVRAATLWAPATTTFPESALYFIRKNRPHDVEKAEKEIAEVIPPEDYKGVSSFGNTHFIKTPIIIHHGTSDESVPFDWGVELDKKLKADNIPHTFYQYEGEDHNFTRGAVSTVFQRDIDFFRSNLTD